MLKIAEPGGSGLWGNVFVMFWPVALLLNEVQEGIFEHCWLSRAIGSAGPLITLCILLCIGRQWRCRALALPSTLIGGGGES